MSWEDIEAIKKLKARYFRYVDTKQWDKWGLLFTENAELHNPLVRDTALRGREQIVATIRGRRAGMVTVHHGHMPEIEIVDQRHARGVWAMFDLLIFAPAEGNGPARYEGYGHYVEEYVKEADGQWRIARLELWRLHVESVEHQRNADASVFSM